MRQAFQRWETATTSLDFEQGDDPEVAGSRARGDAASIAPTTEGDPWGEIVEVDEADLAHEHVEDKTVGEDHRGVTGYDPLAPEGPAL